MLGRHSNDAIAMADFKLVSEAGKGRTRLQAARLLCAPRIDNGETAGSEAIDIAGGNGRAGDPGSCGDQCVEGLDGLAGLKAETTISA